jgi:chromosome segregation ATPase
MSQYDELKRLVEAATETRPTFGAGIAPRQAFRDAANPAAVLDIISKMEGLLAQHGRDSKELRDLCQARDEARKQRDQLKAEVEALRKERDKLADENRSLLEDPGSAL